MFIPTISAEFHGESTSHIVGKYRYTVWVVAENEDASKSELAKAVAKAITFEPTEFTSVKLNEIERFCYGR